MKHPYAMHYDWVGCRRCRLIRWWRRVTRRITRWGI